MTEDEIFRVRRCPEGSMFMTLELHGEDIEFSADGKVAGVYMGVDAARRLARELDQAALAIMHSRPVLPGGRCHDVAPRHRARRAGLLARAGQP